MRTSYGKSQRKCPQCGAEGVLFHVSKYALPAMRFFKCVGCEYRWIGPVPVESTADEESLAARPEDEAESEN